MQLSFLLLFNHGWLPPHSNAEDFVIIRIIYLLNNNYYHYYGIISAYERGHQRPPLTVYTFQPPNPNDANHQESPSTPVVTPVILDSQSHSLGGMKNI